MYRAIEIADELYRERTRRVRIRDSLDGEHASSPAPALSLYRPLNIRAPAGVATANESPARAAC